VNSQWYGTLGESDYNNRRYYCYYCIIKLSDSPLQYDIYAIVLNHLTYLFMRIYTAFLLCYCEGNSGHINSGYSDMRYTVYT